ncbi:MAG: rhodanese-like domain-containing protein [Bacteroidota bacterium]
MSLLKSLFSNKSTQNGTMKVIGVTDFKNAISQGNVQLVDVRTPQEYRQGKIKHAVNIDYFAPDFKHQLQHLDPKKNTYIYCRSGARSRMAAKKMLRLGFENIIDLEGGYINWSKNN